MAGITHAKVSAIEDGADETLVRPSDWNAAHVVEQVITDNAPLTVDQADAASGEYVRLTANGAESRSKAETLADLDLEAGTDFPALTTFETHAARHESGGADQIHSIADDDDDTKIQVEEAADEDIVRMDVKGVEVFKLSAIGELTLAKQSGARAYLNTAQSIPTGGASSGHLLLEVENFDIQNECNVTKVTGTATSTSAGNLKDTGEFTEAAAYYVGRTVWNTTDNTYTTVTGKTDNDTLTLTDDIMASGETYILYFSRITATEAGYYLVVAAVTITDLTDGMAMYSIINKNGTDYLSITNYMATTPTGYTNAIASDIVSLAANDYLTLRTWHNKGSNANILNGSARTFIAMQRVA